MTIGKNTPEKWAKYINDTGDKAPLDTEMKSIPGRMSVSPPLYPSINEVATPPDLVPALVEAFTKKLDALSGKGDVRTLVRQLFFAKLDQWAPVNVQLEVECPKCGTHAQFYISRHDVHRIETRAGCACG